MKMVVPQDTSGNSDNLPPGPNGQQMHVSGVFIVLLELALVVENMLPILVVVVWLPVHARGVGDRLIAAFSVTCILSALVPTPLGLASYFSGGWYGGSATCTTYQVTSLWCNLSSLALLTYMCVNCHFAIWRLRKIKPAAGRQPRRAQCFTQSSTLLYGHATFPQHSPPSSSTASPARSTVTVQPDSTEKRAGTASSPSSNRHVNASTHTTIPDGDTESVNSFNRTFHQLSDSPLREPTSRTRTVLKVDTPELSDDSSKDDKCSTPDNSQKNDVVRNRHLTSQNGRATAVTDPNDYLQIQCSSNQHTDTVGGVDNVHNSVASLHSTVTCTDSGYGYASRKLRPESECDLSQSSSGTMFSRPCQARDYVTLMLFFMYTCTLAMSSLPVVGFGPRLFLSETMCRSWLVPIPTVTKEKTFYVVFLTFVYLCLVVGCSAGISVCMQVSRRMKQERGRRSRLYHEEEDVPDIVELSVLDDMKRQYSLTCIVMAGLLTWLPIVMMLTLQKSGVPVSEATLMYSNIATSLPGLLNPLLYSLALAKYRAGYKAVLEKCCCKRRKQKPHHLREIHSQDATSESGVQPETTMTTDADGHICLHGRTNRSFDNRHEVTIEEEDDDDDDDEDYFPDDGELLEDRKQPLAPKLNEKTPLQAMAVPGPNSTVVRSVLVSRSRSPWQRRNEALSPCNDEECLLTSSSAFVNEETGL